jgi:hypothetical protein
MDRNDWEDGQSKAVQGKDREGGRVDWGIHYGRERYTSGTKIVYLRRRGMDTYLCGQ